MVTQASSSGLCPTGFLVPPDPEDQSKGVLRLRDLRVPRALSQFFLASALSWRCCRTDLIVVIWTKKRKQVEVVPPRGEGCSGFAGGTQVPGVEMGRRCLA